MDRPFPAQSLASPRPARLQLPCRTLLSLLLTFVLVTAAGPPALAAAPEPVAAVDLMRYQGRWLQLATIPAPFQRDCARNTSANYTALSDGLIKVVNRCTAKDGRRITIEGRARVVDESNNAKLQVTFVQQNGTWIFVPGGDYWILGLDADYQWAIVGDPARQGGFVLARQSSLTGLQLLQVLVTLITKGYDPCRFTLTPPGGAAAEPGVNLFSQAFTAICD